jgi:hypothetical protein
MSENGRPMKRKWSPEAREKQRQMMIELNKTHPNIQAGRRKHMNRLHADPEFRAKLMERLKKMAADPEVQARRLAGRLASLDRKRGFHVPPELLKDYRLFRRKRLTPLEAARVLGLPTEVPFQ